MTHEPPCEQSCYKCGSSTIRRIYVANNCPDAEYVRHECRCGNWWLSHTDTEAKIHEAATEWQARVDHKKMCADKGRDPIPDSLLNFVTFQPNLLPMYDQFMRYTEDLFDL